jgi:predicted anti-sigma-YlaC factor YlaD
MAAESMTCKELVELVTEYLEGTLSTAEKRRFEEHLGNCPGCTAYLEQMRRTIRLVGRLTEDDFRQPAREELLNAFRQWKRGS